MSEAMNSDLQKLRDYAAALEAVPIPSVTDAAVKAELSALVFAIEQRCEIVEHWCDEQEGGA